MKKSLQIIFWAILCLFCSMTASAQNRTLTGLVLDDREEPVIGASVIIKETNSGTITDIDGKFSISVPPAAKTLQVSFIGYEAKLVSVQDKNYFEIRLSDSAVLLDEVVAIGYGVAKRGNVTGAIAKMNADKLEDRMVTNVAQALQGQLAGVEIRSTTGEPGQDIQIRVRGASSINATSDPLYVVDGVPADNLSGINPNDIQSIEVLKDASSSAIYGSRGANGVILVTTKQGMNDNKVSVQFSASYGVQSLERKVDMLSPQEWMDFRTYVNDKAYVDRFGNSKGATVQDDWETRKAIIGGVNYNYMNDPRWTQPNYGGLRLINWQNEFFRNAPMQNYQLSVAGGRSNSKYRISLGYLDQEGVAIETDYKRLNLRANVESKIFDRITVGMNVAPSIAWGNGGRIDGKDAQSHVALSIVPIANRMQDFIQVQNLMTDICGQVLPLAP